MDFMNSATRSLIPNKRVGQYAVGNCIRGRARRVSSGSGGDARAISPVTLFRYGFKTNVRCMLNATPTGVTMGGH